MIVVDVETSGTDPQKHSIVSIGAVDFENPNNVFYEECRIPMNTPIEQKALAINGFSEGDITHPKKPEVQEIMHRFFQWVSRIQDKTLAGHNITFDVNFLKAAAKRSSILWTLGYRTVDLHSLAYAHVKSKGLDTPNEGVSSISSEAIFLYCGLPNRKGPHNALEDCRLEVEAFSRLIFKKKKVAMYDSYEIPEALQ